MLTDSNIQIGDSELYKITKFVVYGYQCSVGSSVVWLVPQECAQPSLAGNSRHGRLFRIGLIMRAKQMSTATTAGVIGLLAS